MIVFKICNFLATLTYDDIINFDFKTLFKKNPPKEEEENIIQEDKPLEIEEVA